LRKPLKTVEIDRMKLSKKTTMGLCVLATVLIVAIIVAGAYHERPGRGGGGGGGGGGTPPPASGDFSSDMDMDDAPLGTVFFETYETDESNDVGEYQSYNAESDALCAVSYIPTGILDPTIYLS